MNDRSADNRGVGDSDRALTPRWLAGQPLPYPLYDGGNRFTAVWRGPRR
jgi:hypothetical protein